MATGTRNTALTRESIVGAAVTMLDRAGEAGLTFRALSAELRTGPGAIYWHVANKSELLTAATESVLAGATPPPDPDASPQDTIRAVALGVFDAIDAHPWIGSQLARVPSQPAVLRILERVGQPVQALGVPHAAQFHAASALLNYILGVAGQNAANARAAGEGTARADVFAQALARLDPADYPFTHDIAAQLRDHDDRDQFLAGIDLILAGMATVNTVAMPTATP